MADSQAKAQLDEVRRILGVRGVARRDKVAQIHGVTEPIAPEPTHSFLDDCTDPNPLPLWRSIDAGVSSSDPSRVEHLPSGGPDGGPARRLTVKVGDNFGGWGNRCELGRNNRDDTAQLFPEGSHYEVLYRFMLEPGFRTDLPAWQDIFQFKQVEPYPEDDYAPPGVSMEVQCYYGVLTVNTYWKRRLAFTAPTVGEWHQLRIESKFSKSAGEIVASLDGGAEQVYQGGNLAYRESTGESIPGHMRVGIYHDKSYPDSSVRFSRVEVNPL